MSATSPATPAAEPPASGSEVRNAYLDQSVVGYLLYGVGAVTAFLAAALALSDAAAALHSTFLAMGLLLAGVSGDRLDARLGGRAAQVGTYLLLGLASLLLATALALPATLAGAGLVGFGTGLLLARLNRTLTRGGGSLARVRMGRAALVAMAATIAVPVAIGLGETSGLGWQLAFVIAGGLILVGLWASLGATALAMPRAIAAAPLPRAFRLTWWLLVLGVMVEFSIVFWASTLVSRQTGIDLGSATLVATAFYAGMATTRLGLSTRWLGALDPIALVRFSLLLAMAGSLLAWVTAEVAPATAGIYAAGLGTGALYPLTVSVALAMVPGLGERASARLIIASGVAILVAPLLLGLAADLSSVSTAWLLIPATCVGALALSVPVARSGPGGVA